jgi:hypothetical protein
MRSKWLDWKPNSVGFVGSPSRENPIICCPERARIIENSPEDEATKPTKPPLQDYLSPFEQFLFEAGFCPFCLICLSRSMRDNGGSEACDECGTRFSCSEDMQTELKQ